MNAWFTSRNGRSRSPPSIGLVRSAASITDANLLPACTNKNWETGRDFVKQLLEKKAKHNLYFNPVVCQKSAERYFGTVGVTEKCPDMDLRRYRSPSEA